MERRRGFFFTLHEVKKINNVSEKKEKPMNNHLFHLFFIKVYIFLISGEIII